MFYQSVLFLPSGKTSQQTEQRLRRLQQIWRGLDLWSGDAAESPAWCVVQGHLRGVPWRPVLSGAAVYHAILPGKSEIVMKRVLHVSSWTFCSMWWCFALFNLILVWKPTSLTIFFAAWSRSVSSSDTAPAQNLFLAQPFLPRKWCLLHPSLTRCVRVCVKDVYCKLLYYVIVIWSYKPGSRILFVSLGRRSSGIKQTLTSKAMPGGEYQLCQILAWMSVDTTCKIDLTKILMFHALGIDFRTCKPPAKQEPCHASHAGCLHCLCVPWGAPPLLSELVKTIQEGELYNICEHDSTRFNKIQWPKQGFGHHRLGFKYLEHRRTFCGVKFPDSWNHQKISKHSILSSPDSLYPTQAWPFISNDFTISQMISEK